MSFRSDVARLRRELASKGITTPLPRCPLCGEQTPPLQFSAHTKACERRTAALAVDALDRRLAQIHSTEPRGPEHAACLETEAEWLRQERHERYNELFGFDSQGRGTIKTDAPGWPDDGMPL